MYVGLTVRGWFLPYRGWFSTFSRCVCLAVRGWFLTTGGWFFVIFTAAADFCYIFGGGWFQARMFVCVGLCGCLSAAALRAKRVLMFATDCGWSLQQTDWLWVIFSRLVALAADFRGWCFSETQTDRSHLWLSLLNKVGSSKALVAT